MRLQRSRPLRGRQTRKRTPQRVLCVRKHSSRKPLPGSGTAQAIAMNGDSVDPPLFGVIAAGSHGRPSTRSIMRIAVLSLSKLSCSDVVNAIAIAAVVLGSAQVADN